MEIVDNFKKIEGHKALDFCRKYLNLHFNSEVQEVMNKELRKMGEDNYCLGTCVKENEIKYVGFKFMKENEFTKACDCYCEFISWTLRYCSSRI